MFRAGLALCASAAVLAACATAPTAPLGPPPPGAAAPPSTPGAPQQPAPALPTTPYVSRTDFRAPPGWDSEDHKAALDAFIAGCSAARDAGLATVCRRARALPPQTAVTARDFLESNFQARQLAGEGLLTAYFAPEYEARIGRQGEFTTPMLGRPDDLVSVDLSAFDPTLKGRTIVGQIGPRSFSPYPAREAIESREVARPLAWMKAEDLFFLQIQGSGVLVLPDGRRLKAAFAAHNGVPFVGIATPMRDRGLLANNNTSGDNIRAWLAANRGPAADEVMRLNPRYVFFQTSADDGAHPAGAAGIPLPPGRAIAIDASRHALGGLYWIDASAPALAGAFPTYRRTVVALDTGGAILGDIRADLYLGLGEAAGREAGRVRHRLTMWRLEPR
jgi:membrane-bound lytic murein transglycosylase A